MSETDSAGMANGRLTALPVQLIDTPTGVMLKRGLVQFTVEGEGAREIVTGLLRAASEPITREALAGFFPAPLREDVEQLVEALVGRRILVSAHGDDNGDGPAARQPETPLDVFWWTLGAPREAASEALGEARIAIIGVTAIARQLAAALARCGARGTEVVDFGLLRDVALFGDAEAPDPAEWDLAPPVPYADWSPTAASTPPDCLVVTADFGAGQALRDWNAWALERGVRFLPVMLHDLVGLVGPLVVPGETPCYECFRARENSHLGDPMLQRLAESGGPLEQVANAAHPSMASILGDIAAVELTKLLTGAVAPQGPGRLIEVDLLTPSIQVRRVLRVPRCGACSPLLEAPSVAAEKRPYLPPA